MKLGSGKSLRTTHEKLKDVWGKKKSLLLKLHDTEYHVRIIHILHKCLPDWLELRPALSPALTTSWSYLHTLVEFLSRTRALCP